MNSYNFKNVLKSFKESKKNIDESKKIVSYKEVIIEKLKNNKNEKSILRHFDEIEEERKEWFKERNKCLNIEKNIISEESENKTDEKEISEITGDKLINDIIPQEFQLDLSEKIWEVTVDPKT
jgi:hypothetical protein